MGETQMGCFGFSSWTLHMASIIISSTLWGRALKEWRGTSGRTQGLVAAGLAVLAASDGDRGLPESRSGAARRAGSLQCGGTGAGGLASVNVNF